MDIEYNDICKKMEAKGYEYIQEISAYCVDHTSVAGSITRHIFGEEGEFALFGKKLGNITILRVCGTKYEYEITKANRVVYEHVRTVVFDNRGGMFAEGGYEKVFCNAQFTSNNGTTWYFCNPYWN